MLQRVLEAEVMDSLEEALDYDAMDHRAVNRAFVDDLLLHDFGSDVLDLGTGTARIPIELCQRHAHVRVMAVDLAEHMLDVGRMNVEIASLTDRIMLDRIDAKQLPYEDGQFALVMSNSIVHHMPEPYGVLSEAVRVLGPGGLIFFRDLLRPVNDQALSDLVRAYAGDENEHAQQMFADSLHAALTLDEMRGLVERLNFDPQTVQTTSDRHWTWIARTESKE